MGLQYNDPVPEHDSSFDTLVAAALIAPFHGWDFSWLRDRVDEQDTPWSYPHLARQAIDKAHSLIDLDTGGGEQLAKLQPLPTKSVATEAFEPNIAVAATHLQPLGVEVRTCRGERLPAADREFDLVLNRHARLDIAETWRVLQPGGVFLTQQVGDRNDIELNQALDAPRATRPSPFNVETTVTALERAGFDVLDAREAHPAMVFRDIAAVVYQLRAVSWQIADFDADRYRPQLRRLHRHIRRHASFTSSHHRFLIHARRPA